MKKKKKWIIIVAIVFVGVVAAQMLRNFAFKAEKKSRKLEDAAMEKIAVPVYVADTERLNLNEVLFLTGDIRGRSEVDVFAKVPGKLIKKVKREESYVKKDTIIALVDRDEAAMDYARAEVRAPIAGTLTRYYIDIGGAVSPAVPLLNIADMDEVKVIVNIIEKDISRIKRNQKAIIYVDAYPANPFTGRVDTMNQALDRMTRTAEVRIIVNNSDHLLKPGMFARVEVIIDERKDVLAIPVEAIMGVSTERYVFTIEKERAVRKNVSTGINDGKMIEITGGIRENDIIVTAGQSRLKENAEVKIKNRQKSSSIY